MDDRSYNNKAPLALQVSSGVSLWSVSSFPGVLLAVDFLLRPLGFV